MASHLFVPTSKNLSIAWAEVFLKLMGTGVTELMPAIVTITDIDDGGVTMENNAIRQRLDNELEARGYQPCHTVANTIFPDSLWNPRAENGAEILFDRYNRIWPSIKKCRPNHRGVYFRRLTAYSPNGYSSEPINQLKHIIETFKSGNHRRSALQASVFDPTQDHTHSRQQGFPCLQQVGFVPIDGKALCVTGFYPTQYLFERAYGNYLGLCRLGRFMAAQMGLSFSQMICVTSVARRGDVSKTELEGLASDLRKVINSKRQETM